MKADAMENDLTEYSDTSKGESEKDIRVIIKVKNARILRMMESHGIDSVSELARRVGATASGLGDFINMKQAARKKCNTSEWNLTANKLSKFFKCLPEDLFNESQQYGKLETNTASFDAAPEDIKEFFLDAHSLGPDELLESKENIKNLDLALAKLKPRQERVLRLRFGMYPGSKPMTLEEIGNQWGITREVIRQIEAKAIREMRHPNRSRLLRGVDPSKI